MKFIIYALSGMLSGLIGAMGIGGGGILIIYLTMIEKVEQSKAQGINLLFFLPIAVTAILIYNRKKLIDWKIAVPFSIFGIIGSLVGFWISGIISDRVLAKIFGGMLILMGIKELASGFRQKCCPRDKVICNSEKARG